MPATYLGTSMWSAFPAAVPRVTAMRTVATAQGHYLRCRDWFLGGHCRPPALVVVALNVPGAGEPDDIPGPLPAGSKAGPLIRPWFPGVPGPPARTP